MEKIRIGIVGYGNIGRGVELAIERNQDTLYLQVSRILSASNTYLFV